ncbi:NAD-dependent epimerase/dehydratase family protein [Saccharomonospora sp. NPDC006951]
MKVVVTGGAGFIGANLCEELIRRGYYVVALDDLSTGVAANLDGLDVDLRIGSVADSGFVEGVCRGAGGIVHLAATPPGSRALENPPHCHEVNVTGTLSALEAARREGAHVVAVSSDSVYGEGPVQPTCLAGTPWAASRLAAESYVLAYQRSFGLPSLVLRLFGVFGPLQRFDHPDAAMVPAFVRAALEGRPLTVHGDGTQSLDLTFVDAVVGVLAGAVDRTLTSDEPVDLASGAPATVNDVIGQLSAVLGTRLPVEFAPPRRRDARRAAADTTALRALFPGFGPVPLGQGLLRTVEWQRRQLPDSSVVTV